MIAKIGNSKNTKYLIVQIKIPMKNFLQYKLIELKLLYVIYIDCIYYYINLIYNFIVKKIYFWKKNMIKLYYYKLINKNIF